jgi:osmotically-inducible protein OsmY
LRAWMATDVEIERDVKAELQWDPRVDATDIAVSVRDGVVTLAGFVRQYGDKYAAETATKRVAGVVAVANDIEVRLPTKDQRPDPAIARDAVAAIKSRLPSSWEGIKVVVRDGYINLEGEVEWQYQSETAEAAVRWVPGVRGVSNLIRIRPRAAPPHEVKRRIEDALKRHAEIEARHIVVETNGSEVILKGVVRSPAERDQAVRVAWSAPGVTKVDDRIVVEPL